MNPLLELTACGQSVWLDDLYRELIASGLLRRLIKEDGLRGITSNPSTFQKALEDKDDYQGIIRRQVFQGLSPERLYQLLAVKDVQDAALLLKPVFEATKGSDGFVSLEVSPLLAHDAQGSVEEGRRLWRAIGQPNAMVKIPGTEEGMEAIEKLVAEGISVNVTLLFSREAHAQAAEAFISGLETFFRQGGELASVSSVASFFVSRMDTLLAKCRELPQELKGRVGIANAKLAYLQYRSLFAGERWNRLREKGARPQRVLWASTSVKNPAYRDTLYLEELVAAETVCTVPLATLAAFRDHGQVHAKLPEVGDAEEVLHRLAESGISLSETCAVLLDEGIEKFSASYREILDRLGAWSKEQGMSP